MATKKTSAKAAPVKKAAPKKSTETTVRTVSASTVSTKPKSSTNFDGNMINIALAELLGTFVLTAVALMTAADIVPLFVGLTLAVLVMAIGAVSGSHVNPAVSFGLWSAGKLKAKLLPLYWVSQFVGAMAAVVTINAIAGTKVGLDFGHFGTFAWPIFWIELVGTAVFLFGLVNAASRTDLSNNGKAVGIGLSLMVGILVAGSIYTPMRQQAIANYQTNATAAKDGERPAVSHEIYVKGATLNPAVALAVTESTDSELGISQDKTADKHYSRLSWEVLLATLVGAAAGANLARLINYRFRG